MKEKRKHSAEFKTQVVLDCLKNQLTLSQLSSKYELHPSVIQKWKTEFLTNASSVFSGPKTSNNPEHEKQLERLYSRIGHLHDQVEFLKKKL
jgi:putative transposase